MTPAKIRSRGRFAPRVMSQGRRMLSMAITAIPHTRRKVPIPGEPVA